MAGEYASRVTRLPRPIASRLGRLDIELTERCDNDCIHCCINLPAGDREARARELTTGQIEGLLDEAVGLGCLQVRYTGGEPLLRPDFEDLYVAARRRGLGVMLFTNARRITPGLADLWERMPPLVPIEISVYGMRTESYEAVTRVAGSYAQFRRGVALLEERGIPFIVKSALLPPNRDEIDELDAWALGLPAMRHVASRSLFFQLRDRRDDPAKNRLIASLRATPEEGLAMATRSPDAFRRAMTEFGGKFMGPGGDALFTCGAGCGACVDAYGRAQPCLSLRAPDLCVDLFGAQRVTLAEALTRFKGLRDLRATNPEYLARCARCFLKGFCEQCPARSWTEHGTLDTPVEYLCDVAHTQARWLGWLRADEHGWEVAEWRERVAVGSGRREDAP